MRKSRKKARAKHEAFMTEARLVAQGVALPVRLKDGLIILIELVNANAGGSETNFGFYDALSEGAQGVRECRAALGILRRVLNRLEKDLNGATASHVAWLRVQVAEFEEAQR